MPAAKVGLEDDGGNAGSEAHRIILFRAQRGRIVDRDERAMLCARHYLNQRARIDICDAELHQAHIAVAAVFLR